MARGFARQAMLLAACSAGFFLMAQGAAQGVAMGAMCAFASGALAVAALIAHGAAADR